MKTNAYFDLRLANYDDNDGRYREANNVLYRLVADMPSNKEEHQVVAKFWIIGRTYSAAVERRANAKATPGDFYYDYVAPTIVQSELDAKINAIKSKAYEGVCEDSLRDVLSLHAYLVGLLKGITGKEKRSLASKYLHFHLPELVFIYDQRVSKTIGRFVEGDVKTKELDKSWDVTYAKFALRAYEIYKKLKNEGYASAHGDTLPRLIDTFLLRNYDGVASGGEED